METGNMILRIFLSLSVLSRKNLWYLGTANLTRRCPLFEGWEIILHTLSSITFSEFTDMETYCVGIWVFVTMYTIASGGNQMIMGWKQNYLPSWADARFPFLKWK